MIAHSPYDELQTESGAALLAALSAFDEAHAAAAVSRARSLAAPPVAAAAVATVFARRRARAARKFDRPDDMLFTRDGYEQASSSAVARHRAQRFAGFERVHDLCCGIGSDAVGLAGAACDVTAVDVDSDVLSCAAHNARAAGHAARVRCVRADALAVPLTSAGAAFADPSRRSGGARTRGPHAYVPSLFALLRRARELPGSRLCVKTAPGLDASAPAVRTSLGGAALEVELISERGVCKEAALWCGEFARADGAHRATAIDDDGPHVFDGDANAQAEVAQPSDFVGEPDPALIRSGLLGAWCCARDVFVMDRRVAYVTAPQPPPADPFVRWYRVRDALPFAVKSLRAYLRSRSIGDVVVKTRAFPLEPAAIAALLKARGDERAVLVCTTIGGKKTAIVCYPA